MATFVLFAIEIAFIAILSYSLYITINWGSRCYLQASPLQIDAEGLQT